MLFHQALLSGSSICSPHPQLMGSPPLPSLFQLSRCPLSLTLNWIPRKFSAAAFYPSGTLKRDGRETAPVEIRCGVGLGYTEGIVRSLGTWRERLTWRRLRGREALYWSCIVSTKRKQRGRAETRQPPDWPPSPPSKKKKSSHTHNILNSIFRHSRSHREVYLQVGLLFYAFSPGQCANSVLEGHTCVCCVCVEERSR